MDGLALCRSNSGKITLNVVTLSDRGSEENDQTPLHESDHTFPTQGVMSRCERGRKTVLVINIISKCL